MLAADYIIIGRLPRSGEWCPVTWVLRGVWQLCAARGSVVLLADSRRTHQEQLVRALGELGVEASFEERTLSSGEAVSLLQSQIS